IGAVSPNGIGFGPFGRACQQGISGITALTGIHMDGLRSSAAAQVRNWDVLSAVDPVTARRTPRMIPMAIAAAQEALAQANFVIDPADVDQQRRIGISLGTGGGGLAFVEEQYRAFFQEGKGSLFSITAGTHGNLSSEISIALRLRGPSHVISTGCTSSTDAIGYAAMLIRTGAIDAMLAGGADAPISQCILTAFERMRVISQRRWDDPAQSSRPFDRQRDGFVLGEGAWMFLLEAEDSAVRRGASPLAELAGYAATCDAYHRVQIAPDLLEPVRAIELALADAGAAPGDIDYVNLHGTSTELNDRMETAAMHKVFGPRARAVPMSSTKSMIGHPQGACGAAGLAATIYCMRTELLHPTINLDEADPDCDLDYVPHAPRSATAKTALCNCIAFGSKNSALIVRNF
ncbi:MAG TPA: beta-ketoacyl-[acyl-carrier-protein] synthase family protein, partial [Tepidisphaeraceae bacterium]|nr:beta-ketoacyl-[acyl-carrier-protein] synthase family protein [Tepidisphaeraceae bacterium]